MSRPDRILVIDDDTVVGEVINASAQAMGLQCIVTREPDSFSNLLGSDATLILLDLMMPDMDGIEVLRHLGAMQCNARIVLMSAMDRRVIETVEKLAQSLGLSIVGRLDKPFPIQDLVRLIHSLGEQEDADSPLKQPLIPMSDAEITDAIERGVIVSYFQPQISLSTGNVTGVEALARWPHPDAGLIFPDSFIARAEALGLIDQIFWSTAGQALSSAKLFAAPDGTLPRLSLNASVQSLRNLNFPDSLVRLARDHDFPTDRLVIEITESGLIQELSRTLDVLTRLRMRGIRLSIDDFGVGYAMMRQLQNVPATEIKIDQGSVQTMHANESNRVMVQKIIEMGHELGMEVIAEGVITEDQVEMLRRWNCDGAQGYLYSRPLPASELIPWLAKYRATLAN
jgi:EAL domain-containing protein (putative c-di-GMP-specific phosphodiesterase class I)/ActR/RegA family two-component response regulator